eukprot:scaffold9972_cov118-Isochrysis_galbana.AAC.15
MRVQYPARGNERVGRSPRLPLRSAGPGVWTTAVVPDTGAPRCADERMRSSQAHLQRNWTCPIHSHPLFNTEGERQLKYDSCGFPPCYAAHRRHCVWG